VIPRGLTRAHVLAAMARGDAGGVPAGREGRAFEVRHEARVYPPKLLCPLRARRPSAGRFRARRLLEETALAALKEAYEHGVRYVLFTHGWSTSEGWRQTTARSVVRTLMRSRAATPYIVRRECIQHNSAFVAAIRPKESRPT